MYVNGLVCLAGGQCRPSFSFLTLHGLCYIGFNTTGKLLVVPPGVARDSGIHYQYKYDERKDNRNALTLQSLSTLAGDKMRKGGECTVCPYIDEYQMFINYYGDKNYADKWILAASYSQHTNFETGRGNADFSRFTEKSSIAEAMTKGTVLMSVFMAVIREMEVALSECEARMRGESDEPVMTVDNAVAFYAGSLEGEEGSGSGRFLYDVANRQALLFATAGEENDDDVGTAFVNLEVIRELKKMQLYVLEGNCASARTSKEYIVSLMKVPLVQGVLHYAYMRQFQRPTLPVDIEKTEAEGATFAAALVPFVHHCTPADGVIIHQNMKVGSLMENVDFQAVKSALERNYACMNIDCKLVGGLWMVDSYADGAEPCSFDFRSAGGSANAGVVAGATIGALAAVVLLGLVFTRLRSGRSRRNKANGQRRASNIAAVSEIS